MSDQAQAFAVKRGNANGAAHQVRRELADAGFTGDRPPLGRLVSTFVREGLQALLRSLGIERESEADTTDESGSETAEVGNGEEPQPTPLPVAEDRPVTTVDIAA